MGRKVVQALGGNAHVKEVGVLGLPFRAVSYHSGS